MKTVLNTRVQ